MSSITISSYQPSARLLPFVAAYWTGDFNRQAEHLFAQSVVPNGMIELIIHLNTDHCALTKNNKSWDTSPDYTLIGLHTTPYEVKFPARVQVFCIRFYPEALTHIFAVPSATILDTHEDSTDVFGTGFRTYCDRLRDVDTTNERITITEQYLAKNLAARNQRFDYVQLAAGIIREQQGLLNLETLMRQVPISLRQLQRTFKMRTGITAKEYMRLMRMNAIQQYMQGNAQPDFTDLTYEYGFADQSHFIREFRSLTGAVPRSFLQKRNHFLVNIQ